MPVYRDKRGRYVVDFRAQGRRIFRRCPKGATAAQARTYEAKLRTDLWHQRLGKGPSVSLASALQNHIQKSIKGTRSEGRAEASVYRLMEYVRDKPIEAAPAVAESFVEAMRGQYSIASINRSLAALRRSCSLAYVAGWTTEPVHKRIALLPGEVKRTTWLTRAEVHRLVAAAKYQRTKDLILLLAYTGLRLGELLSLTKADVRGGIIHVVTGKTGDMRAIPVHPAIKDAVKRLPLEGARRNIQTSFDWARKKAGLRHVRIHDLRHTFGSWLAQAGVQLPTIMELMGHKSAATAKRYLHLDTSAKKKAIGMLT
jgi:integrase